MKWCLVWRKLEGEVNGAFDFTDVAVRQQTVAGGSGLVQNLCGVDYSCYEIKADQLALVTPPAAMFKEPLGRFDGETGTGKRWLRILARWLTVKPLELDYLANVAA